MKAIHCIKSVVAAVAVVVVGDSCTGMCTHLSAEAQNIVFRGKADSVVVATSPEQIALTAGEVKMMQEKVAMVGSILEIVLDNSKNSTENQYNTKDKAVDLAATAVTHMTKKGQALTVRSGRTTFMMSQPVYCKFGEIQPGTRGKVKYFRSLGRRVFIPLP